MPNKNRKAAAQSTPLTHDAIRDGLARTHGDIVGAVHKVLKNAGLPGLKVSSLQFTPPEDLGDPCPLACPKGQHCVWDSNGGVVRPVCVPD